MKRARTAALVLLVLCWPAAQAMTVLMLQRLVQAEAVRQVAYHETRESPWLTTPVVSSGTLHDMGGYLEKRVATPRRETWRLWPDKIEWVDADGGRSKVIGHDKAADLAALSHLMRRVVAGDFTGLERDYLIDISGNESLWSARLTARRSDAIRAVNHVELQGTAGRLQVIVVVERQGERTTTRLHHQ